MDGWAWRVLAPRILGGRRLLVVAGDRGLLALSFVGRTEASVRRSLEGLERWPADRPGPPAGARARGHLELAIRELEGYFRGETREFTVECDLEGRGGPVDREVWKALRRIPWGTVATYGEVARRIGSPRASRAVGGAAGRNPIAIVIPCHRVIGAGGRLVGFGPGLPLKAALLEHEGVPLRFRGPSAVGDLRTVVCRA